MKRMFCLTLLLLVALVPALPAGAQEADPAAIPPPAAPAPGTPVPESVVSGPSPFSASLLFVKADWSQAGEAKQIAAELWKVLEGTSVPQELLGKLPAAGPQVLFPPEIVSQYSAQHYAELLAWLKAKGLVEKVTPFPPAAGEQIPLDSFSATIDGQATGLTIAYDTLDLPPISQSPSQPFITREPAFTWNLYSTDQDKMRLVVGRHLAQVERALGQPPKSLDPLDRISFDITGLASGEVAIANAFPGEREGPFREAARRRGYDILLVIEQGPQPQPAGKEATSRLVLPDKVNALEVHNHRSYQWPTTQRRGNPTKAADPEPAAESAAERPAPAAEEPAVVTRVYDLQHAQAASVHDMLFFLFQRRVFSGELDFAAEPSVNRLVVRGTAKDIEEIDAILKQIDRPGKAGDEQSGSGGAAEMRDTPGGDSGMMLGGPTVSRDVLQQEYDALEKEAAELARELRKPMGMGGSAAREKLRALVAQAFAARQQLHQAELAALAERLQKTRETLAMRQRIQKTIIDRRVEDLLNPNLQWEAPAAAGGQAGGDAAVPAAAEPLQLPKLGVAERIREQLGFARNLQGTWLQVAQVRDGKRTEAREGTFVNATFAGNRYELRMGAEKYASGTFTLGGTTDNLRQIDTTRTWLQGESAGTSGGHHERGLMDISLFDRNTLNWFPNGRTTRRRPTSIPPSPYDEQYSPYEYRTIWKRISSQPLSDEQLQALDLAKLAAEGTAEPKPAPNTPAPTTP
ncbi:MAG: secretin N-terminal domain-containing protein [Pirellulaceae bacterium]